MTKIRLVIPGLALGLILLALRLEASINPIDVCDPDAIAENGAKSMPRILKAYTMGMLVSNEDSMSSRETLLGSDGLNVFFKNTFADREVNLIGDYVRNQLIEIIRTPPTTDHVQCVVSNLKAAAEMGHWIFGYNSTQGPHPVDPGWVFRYNDFQEVYTGTDIIMGIPCNRWEACREIPMRDKTKQTVGIKFHWSDPEMWTPVAGLDINNRPVSVPVLMEVSTEKNGRVITERSFVFRYSNMAPEKQEFHIPPGVYCAGLKTENITLPKIPDHFSYESEIMMKRGFEQFVFQQKHYYDGFHNLTRMDFRPLLDNQADEDKIIKNKAAQLVLIYDYNLGVSYLINEDTGTCEMGHIDNVEDKSHTKERMHNPMALLNLDAVTYEYAGQKKVRDILANQFVVVKKGEIDMVYKYSFSADLVQMQGVGRWTNNKPLKFSTYPLEDPDNDVASVHTNIFNFDVDVSDVFKHDISSCISPPQRLYVTFQFPASCLHLKMVDRTQFKIQVLHALVENMKVSLLRINNMQFKMNESVTTVSFNLLMKQSTPGNDETNTENSSQDAVQILKKLINKGLLTVEIPGESQDFVAARKNSLRVLKERLATFPSTRQEI